VLAQHIELVGDRTRHLGRDDGSLDLVEPLEQLGALLGARLRQGGALEAISSP
jgi:hypothetical protein